MSRRRDLTYLFLETFTRPLETCVFEGTLACFLGCILSVSLTTKLVIQFITGPCAAAELLTRCGITGEHKSQSTSLLPDIHTEFHLAAVLFP